MGLMWIALGSGKIASAIDEGARRVYSALAIENSPYISAHSFERFGVLWVALCALMWLIMYIKTDAAYIGQEAGGKRRPAFLAAGAVLVAALSILIQSAVEFQTASQAYFAFGMSAALLSLSGVCLRQLQSALRRGMPVTADSYLLAAFLTLFGAVRAMLVYMEIAPLTPFSHTAFSIILYAPIFVGYFWMRRRLNQIREAHEPMLEMEHAE